MIRLETDILYSKLTKPVCIPKANEQTWPSACWTLSPHRGAKYRTDYAPLQACDRKEVKLGFCTERVRDCSSFHIDTPIVCLGPYNNIEIHGYLKSCDKNRMLWSQLASAENNKWVINSAKEMPPPPDNVVPLDLNLFPLATTTTSEPPTTIKSFGFKNVDSYFMQQQAAALLSSSNKNNNKPDKIIKESFSDQPKKVNFEMFTPPSGPAVTFHAFGGGNRPGLQSMGRPSDQFSLAKKRVPSAVLKSLPLSKEESKGALQCMTCRGKSVFDCHARGHWSMCGANEATG